MIPISLRLSFSPESLDARRLKDLGATIVSARVSATWTAARRSLVAIGIEIVDAVASYILLRTTDATTLGSGGQGVTVLRNVFGKPGA